MKNIVITGASRGVGVMLAKGLAKKGHTIICLGRSEQQLKEVVIKIKSAGGNAAYQIVDMMEKEQVVKAGITWTSIHNQMRQKQRQLGKQSHQHQH